LPDYLRISEYHLTYGQSHADLQRIENLQHSQEKILQQIKKRTQVQQSDSKESMFLAASNPIHHKTVLARAQKVADIKYILKLSLNWEKE